MSEDQDQGGQQPVDDDGSVRFNPPITSTTHILPFERLSPLDFERLCLWLVEREGYTHAEHLGQAGSEQGRDVIAYKPTSQGEELWYFQCKRYRSIRARTLKDEVDKYLKLAQEKPHLKPFGVVFVVSCAVSADAREEVGAYCEQHNLAPEFWALTELDLRVKRHPGLLREFFGLYARPIGVPFQAPPLPVHFVPRLEVSEALKARLLADEAAAPGVLVVSAIHGLGGIGKSVLAAALAHDPEVQARFPDGVLWAILGQQPEILSLLSSWIQATGDYDFHPTTVEAASAHLRTLLHDKTALLVVDDVWDPTHALPFQIGGPRCQVLITTRRADVTDEVGAVLYQLDVMTPEQSLDLLSARLGRKLAEGEREEALRLAEAVGYLPLALELAAARVARGTPWDTLWDALEEEIARLEMLEGPRRRRKVRPRLEASFNLSLNALRAEDETAWQAFVWLGVLPEDVLVAAPMAATLWEMDQAEASDMLELLWNDALLLPGPPVQVGEQTRPAYRLHDLLHDMARRLLTTEQPQGLGFTLPQAHARFLEQYLAWTRDGLWHTLSDDAYVHAHLAWHMERAGWADELHALLREETSKGRNAWHEACERLGQTAGYLEDMGRAWRLAEGAFANGQSQNAIGLQCRYALITASLNSLAGNISPDLLAALVEEGIWSPAQGLAYARRVPELRQRAEALAKLASHLPEVESGETLREALAAARAIEGKWEQEKVLAELASRLPETERAKALCEALAAAWAIENDNDRASALAELAPRLAELGHPQEALTVAQEIGDEGKRAWALARLALHLPEDLLREALAAAWVIENDNDRAGALAELAPRLAELGHPQEALEAAQEIRSSYYRARALAGLAPHLLEMLKGGVLREALTAARAITSGTDRARVLAELVPHLTEAKQEEIPDWLRELSPKPGVPPTMPAEAPPSVEEEGEEESPDWLRELRPEPLGGLLSWRYYLRRYLTEAERVGDLLEELAATREIGDEYDRASALAQLAPHLPEAERIRALLEELAAMRAIRDEHNRAKSLAVLAPHMAELGHHQEVLAAVQEIEDEFDRAWALARLPPHLPGPLLRGALAVARKMSEWGRAEVLYGLAPHLPEPLLPEVLEAARAIEEDDWRASALAQLARRLAELGHPQEALAVVQEIGDEDDRAWALARLVSHLPEDLLREALAMAQEIGDEDDRAWALARLPPHLPEPLLQEVLTAARAIENADNRASVLAQLARRLAELGHPQEAVAVAQEIGDEDDRAEALVRLTPHLPEPLLQEVLTAARAIENADNRASVLAQLARRLAELGHPQEAVAVAQEIEDEFDRAWALAVLGLRLAELGHPHEALAVAQEIRDEDYRAWALATMAPRLAELGRPQEALEAARAERDKRRLAKALAGLTPHLSEAKRVETLREALGAARVVEGKRWRAEVLAELASHLAQLSCQHLYPLWQATLPILATRTRKNLLSDLLALIPVIAALGGEEAIAETFYAIQDVGRWWP